MFNDKTYESLLQEKLDQVSSEYDKREGSVIYDAFAPNSAEMAQAYITLSWLFDQMFGDTATRENLIKIAKDTRGLGPFDSTYAVRKGEFNVIVPIGTRFSIEDVNFSVTLPMGEPEESGRYTYQLTCETKGEIGNRYTGNLIPIDFISGLSYAKLTDILIPGEEEEGTDEFRERWRKAFNSTAFGGNRADYKQKIKAINGVGGVKCYRSTDEHGKMLGGYVKCVIITSEYTVPSPILIASIQEMIDPTKTGSGDGFAPIGHHVAVCAIETEQIDIQSEITFADNYNYEDSRDEIVQAIRTYFKMLAKEWENSLLTIVRISAIENAVLGVTGVIDVGNTKLNGVATNMTLQEDAIPILGVLEVIR